MGFAQPRFPSHAERSTEALMQRHRQSQDRINGQIATHVLHVIAPLKPMRDDLRFKERNVLPTIVIARHFSRSPFGSGATL